MPKGETVKVTLANYDRQIDTLTKRIVEVIGRNDTLEKHYADQSLAYSAARDELFNLKRDLIRIEGWRDCARELLKIESKEIQDQSIADFIRHAQVNAS